MNSKCLNSEKEGLHNEHFNYSKKRTCFHEVAFDARNAQKMNNYFCVGEARRQNTLISIQTARKAPERNLRRVCAFEPPSSLSTSFTNENGQNTTISDVGVLNSAGLFQIRAFCSNSAPARCHVLKLSHLIRRGQVEAVEEFDEASDSISINFKKLCRSGNFNMHLNSCVVEVFGHQNMTSNRL